MPRLGDDLEAIIRKLSAAGAGEGKHEFETTAEYDARRNRATPQGQLVFVIQEAAGFEYDADAEQMTASVESGSRDFHQGSERCPGVAAKKVRTLQDKYLGQNAFGVAKEIKVSVYDEFGICLAPTSPMHFDSGYMDIGRGSTKFSFAMDRDEARASKPYLRFAVVGTVAEGVVHTDDDYHSPTISEPYDITTHCYYLPLVVSETRIIDSRTGEVVSHFIPEYKTSGK
ncbi:MAG: hypothetical protein ACLQPN_22475 [Bryobacteraceae bacterium]